MCDIKYVCVCVHLKSEHLNALHVVSLGVFLYYYFLKHDHKQRITGRLTDGTAFPLTVQLTSKIHDANSRDKMKRPKDVIYTGKVTVYATLSGMITFLPDGTIHGCNHHFALMLTGYSGDQLKGQVN